MDLKTRLLPLFGVFFLLASSTFGAPGDDAQIDKRMKTWMSEVLAPCCWTNTLAEHHSEVSSELKRRIHGWLVAGLADQTIREQLVAEYGERILAKPRARGFNWLVWVMPPLVLALAALGARFYLRKRLRVQPVVRLPEIEAKDMDKARHAIETELAERAR